VTAGAAAAAAAAAPGRAAASAVPGRQLERLLRAVRGHGDRQAEARRDLRVRRRRAARQHDRAFGEFPRRVGDPEVGDPHAGKQRAEQRGRRQVHGGVERQAHGRLRLPGILRNEHERRRERVTVGVRDDDIGADGLLLEVQQRLRLAELQVG